MAKFAAYTPGVLPRFLVAMFSYTHFENTPPPTYVGLRFVRKKKWRTAPKVYLKKGWWSRIPSYGANIIWQYNMKNLFTPKGGILRRAVLIVEK